jgi:DNA mismatch endonuclease, patch repair protein
MSAKAVSVSVTNGSRTRANAVVPRPPPPSSPRVSAVMKGNRGRETSVELALRKALWSAGLRGYRTNYARIPGRPDITYVGRRVAIFTHGCFWHRCPQHAKSLPRSHREYWKLKFKLNRQRDVRKVEQLRALGWNVVILWECEIREKIADSVVRVSHALNSSAAHLDHASAPRI